MFGFVVYCDKYDRMLVTHLPIKESIVEKNELTVLRRFSDTNIKTVSIALNNFLMGLNISYSLFGYNLHIKIVPEMQKYINPDIPFNNSTEDLIERMSSVYPSLRNLNNSNISVN